MSDGNQAVLWNELKALRAEIEAVRKGDMKALELQAKKYERRLDELNHSHSLAAERYAQYVSRELHDVSFARVDRDISVLSRIVYIGIGMVMVANVILFATVEHLSKP